MLLEFLAVVLALILSVGVSLIIYARWNYGTLESMGVPVEKPHWLWGNMGNLRNEYVHWEDVRRSKELGSIYGVYEGRTPIVHIADVNVIHKILFTESDHFEKRAQDLGDPIINEMIELLNGEKWKIVKNMLSPQFTTGKLKMQSGILVNVCEDYVQHLNSKMDAKGRIEKVDLHEMFAPFTIQVIGEMLCGIKLENARDPSNEFVNNLRKALFDGVVLDESMKYIYTFPFLAKFLPLSDKKTMGTLRTLLTDVLAARENSSNSTPDMVSVLLEMQHRSRKDPDYKRLGITEHTVFGQAFEFFIASFLGIVITTKTLFYHLLTNPEVHQKVLDEIEAVLAKFKGQVSYDAVVEMEYLGACVIETLRISPSFFRPERTCIKDWTHGNLKIPKGMHVTFPVYAIHHNKEIYANPKKFEPERFLGESKAKLPPCAFMTFGQGPRQCMGMRLAIQLIKIWVVSLLKEFIVEKRVDTVWKEAKANNLFVTWDPIYVDFVKK